MKKQKVIYTITVLSKHLGGKLNICDWCYYFKQEDAEEVIETNATDISKLDYYHYAVLASKTEGPLAIPETIQWYEFIWKHIDDQNSEFIEAKKIDCPSQFKHTFFE